MDAPQSRTSQAEEDVLGGRIFYGLFSIFLLGFAGGYWYMRISDLCTGSWLTDTLGYCFVVVGVIFVFIATQSNEPQSGATGCSRHIAKRPHGERAEWIVRWTYRHLRWPLVVVSGGEAAMFLFWAASFNSYVAPACLLGFFFLAISVAGVLTSPLDLESRRD